MRSARKEEILMSDNVLAEAKIIPVREKSEYFESAVEYFSAKWAVPKRVYQDCIKNSIITDSPLPRWYLLVSDSGVIIGSYGLIVNDFISRQDLWPWLCALYVEKSFRGHAYGAIMLEHGRQEAKRLGFRKLYLHTDHVNYYEKYDWQYIGIGYDSGGQPSRIYEVTL